MRCFLRNCFNDYQSFEIHQDILVSEACLTAFDSLVSFNSVTENPVSSVVFWNIKRATSDETEVDLYRLLKANNLIFASIENFSLLFLAEKFLKHRSEIIFYLGPSLKKNTLISLAKFFNKHRLNFVTFNSQVPLFYFPIFRQKKLVYAC